ncbi:nitrite reductase/ring-hydroxylating ferredoxin subunit [Saccharopolyspora lacisalsi]|uniref:Nitrite reductase/ring-hydroxylating ferredoxin subunit n=1 Tax=Halosaccharopolyspora lacisalsi TaxID=1000566 RepID=A0A839DXV6_9PSEU|nr:Rieske 2Fe-2S domain-containing protein [Halosaccharopolyspora lacisalsi]MBA8823578.1 nitrite reductase/ring-hydroxylating ferredoxin subunit [Halosaccharopolyspora lacisalsi]
MTRNGDVGAMDPGVRELLDKIEAAGVPETRRTAEDLVRTVGECYGEGLGRIVGILRGRGEVGGELLRWLAADDLVGGLLAVHGLHPNARACWMDVRAARTLGPGELMSVWAEYDSVLVCNASGELYAYRDRCPACTAALAEADLDGAVLTCPGCQEPYDVRAAGGGVLDPHAQLDPLPLRSDGTTVWVAVPVEIAS